MKHCFDRLGNATTQHNASGLSKLLSQAANDKEARGGTGVSSYFRRHEVAITRCHWQVMKFSLIPNSLMEVLFLNSLANFILGFR